MPGWNPALEAYSGHSGSGGLSQPQEKSPSKTNFWPRLWSPSSIFDKFTPMLPTRQVITSHPPCYHYTAAAADNVMHASVITTYHAVALQLLLARTMKSKRYRPEAITNRSNSLEGWPRGCLQALAGDTCPLPCPEEAKNVKYVALCLNKLTYLHVLNKLTARVGGVR